MGMWRFRSWARLERADCFAGLGSGLAYMLMRIDTCHVRVLLFLHTTLVTFFIACRVPLFMVVGGPVPVKHVRRGEPGFEAAVDEAHAALCDALGQL